LGKLLLKRLHLGPLTALIDDHLVELFVLMLQMGEVGFDLFDALGKFFIHGPNVIGLCRKAKCDFTRGVATKQNVKLTGRLLEEHVARLRVCTLCPNMHKPVVSGGAVVSKVMLVGQAPGDKEPIAGRPFAWTAGKTLFKWFNEAAGMTEEQFRASIYMAAVCRCFPGKKLTGGDRVPSPEEVQTCSTWLKREVEILEPDLVIPVGKLAIEQFIPPRKLDEIIGKQMRVTYAGREFDLVPLPHPSGASPWHRMEPGKSLLKQALKIIAEHPAFQELV
jgi:uracil-DNA glycosylase